jgi:hypothetical protein
MVILTAADKFIPSELILSVTLILPLFAAYTTAIIKFLLNPERKEKKEKKVNYTVFLITFTVPVLFIIYIASIIIWKAFGPISFDTFKSLLGVGETAFGVYVGMIVNSTFKE